MRILVGTTAVNLPGGRARPVIQNLGPGDIYIDTDGDVDADSGLKLVPNAVYEFPTSGSLSEIWVVATAENTDIRVVGMGG